jgi:hypothetical protein
MIGGTADIDMNGVAESQMLDHGGRVSGVVVHVVAVRHLARASVAAPIDTDDAVAMLDEEQHLGVPVVGAERPPVVEDDRLAFAPVFVEDLDSFAGCDRAHAACSWV